MEVMRMKWMIKGGTVMTQDDEDHWLENGDIVIDEGKIVALGYDLHPDHFGVEKVLPAQDKLVMPGLVNAHFHSHDRFDKGRLDNVPLEAYMALYNPPLGRRRWTPRDCYLRTLLGAFEMLRTGTTTVIDDVVHLPPSKENVEAVFQAYEDVGMRALVSIHYSDKPYYRTIPYLDELLPGNLKEEMNQPSALSPDDFFDLCRHCARRWRGRVGYVLSPSGPQRCTDGFLERTWELSRQLDLPVISHVLETKVQAITGHLFYGKSLIEHMDSMGILTPKTSLIHGVWVTDRDLGLISKAGCSIIHNPVSNMKLGSGIARIRKMLDAGINVGLGTDANSSNDTANLFEALKMAALLHKVSDFHYDRWVGAKEVLRMATRGGARCGCLHGDIGTLSVGMRADIVLIDLNTIPFFPRNNLLHQLVFCEHGESVDTVIVDGNPVVERGRITSVNEEAILDEVRGREEEIKDMIRRSAARGSELEPYVRRAYERCVEQDAMVKNVFLADGE
jgi:guanine deaminase